MAQPMIEAHQLTRAFGDFLAVDQISFSIPSGQVAAFLGANGAGKTTTMRLLTGYLAPTSGTATICGLDMKTHRMEAARRLGYLPENGPLYPDLTPAESLQFFGRARGLIGPRLRTRIEEVVELCNLEEVFRKSIGKLSKGYKQRVGMAQALLHDPDVLILDEPTSGLDPHQVRQMRATLRRLGKSKAVLLSTHILPEVQTVADRVLLIHDGRLLFDDTPQAFAESGKSDLDQAFLQITGATT